MGNSVKELRDIIKHVPIKKAVLSENENLHSVFMQHGRPGVMQVIQNAEELEEVEEVAVTNVVTPIISIAKTEIQEDESEVHYHDNFESNDETTESEKQTKLVVIHDNKILMRSSINDYYVLGMLTQDLSSMRITLMIEDLAYGKKERTKIDLYERETVRNLALQLAELFYENSETIEADLFLLTDLLEKHREKQFELAKPAYQSKRQYANISPETQKACIEFLSQPNLIERFDGMIEKAGVVGEENTRKLLLVIASTYKMSHPLHALVQGSSGSGKSHLINIIGQCLPPEDMLSMTRVTSKSFYHYNKDELVDKLMLIQDYDGLDEEAQYAFRELQSAGNISSSTTYKDRTGNIVSCVKNVNSHFASLLATTKAEVYYDNMSRSVIIGVDETDEQTMRIIDYQNKRLAGLIDIREEQKAKEFMQNCMRCVKPCEVVNKYADKIILPIEAKMLRRLNSHYQAFVKQITILHQYQRKRDEQGRLIAEPEDLKMACDILFDAIMLKVDDLDSSLRHFFDRMKEFIKKQAAGKQTEFQFTQRDVRLALNVSKTQCFRFMEDLELLEYVQKTGGYANRGFKYKIVFWDDMEKMREKIKTGLLNQLAQLDGLKKPLVLGGSEDLEHQNPHTQGE
ncbi:MAG: hypothetical protein Q8T03_13515 [Bacteroidota bacterium]|nr:hypothetical protein [Bacteroidota bacterium]MDP3558385.1 hypothetical protein [Bacteroidota bacterium]